MACDLWRAKMDAYADAELPAEEMRALDAHLRACPACAGDALSRVQWKRAMQLAGKRYTPSPDFRRRIEQQTAAPKRAAWLGNWLPRLAVATVAVVLVLFAGNRWLVSQREKTFGELADLHAATLASTSPVDVVSTDRHTVKPWFEGKLPFTFNLPELENTPFTLLGARITYLDQAPGAQLLFQLRKHRISVFIFQDRSEWARPISAGTTLSKKLSFTVETWSEGGLRYFVIGDTGAEDIRKLGELLRAAARS
jgi:anti-sigma factor RsiW